MWSHDTHMIVIELYNVWMLQMLERGREEGREGRREGGRGGGREGGREGKREGGMEGKTKMMQYTVQITTSRCHGYLKNGYLLLPCNGEFPRNIL